LRAFSTSERPRQAGRIHYDPCTDPISLRDWPCLFPRLVASIGPGLRRLESRTARADAVDGRRLPGDDRVKGDEGELSSLRRVGALAFVAGGLAACGAAAAAALTSGSHALAAQQPVTLGSVTGNPTGNICAASIKCTYVPFTSVSAPELQVPSDGTVTSFQVNAGSSTGTVWLRVLRPAGGGQYTGVGTSAPETLALGVNTFSASLPVQAGDVIGLDNDSSALMFDTGTVTPITAYYEAPALADGATAAPNQTKPGYRLLLSATVTPTSSTNTTSTTTTTTTTTSSTTTSSATLTLSRVGQSHRVWRESGEPKKHGPPIGTRFSFTLNEVALVTLSFKHRPSGRTAGTIRVNGHRGVNRRSFRGRIGRTKKLVPGRYTVVVRATHSNANTPKPAALRFTIARP
jgi:hypothetical protein